MPRKPYTIHYIYKTTNIITGKFYVGMHSTFNLDDGYIGSGKRLWYSMNKYGKEKHKKEILEFCKNRKELVRREKEIVNKEFIKDKLCMNLMVGGKGGYHINSFGGKNGRIKGGKNFLDKFKNDDVFRKNHLNKLSESHKNEYINGRKKMPPSFLGRKHTSETIEKMKKSMKGKQTGKLNSQYGTCWIIKNNENKKIDKTFLEEWLKLGWIQGRKIN